MIAWVVDRREDADLQRAQRRFLAAAFQLADALVDQGEEIGHAIGHRRIRRVGVLVALPAHQRRVGAAKRLLGLGDDIAQHIHLLGDRRAAAEDNLGEFV